MLQRMTSESKTAPFVRLGAFTGPERVFYEKGGRAFPLRKDWELGGSKLAYIVVRTIRFIRAWV
jgi:hypothetical protein